MAKCSMCGKKGLFLKLKNGLCSTCANKTANETTEEWLLRTNPDYAKLKGVNEHYDKLISSIWEARNQYKADNDIDKIISVYEYALIYATPPLKNAQSHVLYLAELYIKNKQNDKAWGYLNSLLLSHRDITHKIRFLQCKILKKEKRYIDAMQMLMLGYLFKSQYTTVFQKEAFLKEATVIANKLEWDTSKTKFLAQIIEYQVKHKNYDEGLMINKYIEAIESFNSK